MVTNLVEQWATQQALLEYLAARFPLQIEEVLVDGRSFQVHSVANPHDHIDHLMGQVVDGDFQWEPFWAQAWPSARLLAEWMSGAPEIDWERATVLDLGCGVGLCGSVAAALGAQVVLADYAEPAVLFATSNAWPWRSRVTTAVVDWHHDDLGQRFSVILGADIVYEQRNWQALDQFFKRHLLSSGKVVMTEPGRDTGQSVQDFFRAQGWNLETSELAIQANGRPLRLLIATLPSPH